MLHLSVSLVPLLVLVSYFQIYQHEVAHHTALIFRDWFCVQLCLAPFAALFIDHSASLLRLACVLAL